MLLKRLIYGTFLWVMGWKTTTKLPEGIPKYLLILVPHTSNWDFPFGATCRPFLNIDGCKFLIKKEWTTKPIVGSIIRWLGAIPVDRSKKGGNLVDQVVEQFNRAETLGVTVTPEGTRSLNPKWKTGFYHIAVKAQVPIVCSFIDYHRREIGMGKIFHPSGDLEKDMEIIQEYYKDITPKYPEKSNLNHLPPTTKHSIWWKLTPYFRLGLLIMGLLALLNIKTLIYGAQQGWGQAQIILKAKPVSSYLSDPSYPEEKKEKLRLINEIRQYAFDSLGLDKTESYTKMYDQHGKPLLWNVTACKPYQLKAYKWKFPILGSFSYKGFFDSTKAVAQAHALAQEGYDTNIRTVGGWSTLGVLNDPILSGMLNRSTGNLANLIIHELTHGTLYIKDGVSYNENLANFVGNVGAKQFLEDKYGLDSPEYRQYMEQRSDRKQFTAYALAKAEELDSLYGTFTPQLQKDEKEKIKQRFIHGFIQDLKQVNFYNQGYYSYFDRTLPNNTFFMSRRRYSGKQEQFQREFTQKFDSNLRNYLSYLKEKYPSIF